MRLRRLLLRVHCGDGGELNSTMNKGWEWY